MIILILALRNDSIGTINEISIYNNSIDNDNNDNSIAIYIYIYIVYIENRC